MSDKPVYGGRSGKQSDDLLDFVSELVRKREETLRLLTFLVGQDNTLEVFADALRLKLM